MRLLPTPMQLLIQGQWWSKLCTQRLQTKQCLLLSGLIISQLGHNFVLSQLMISVIKFSYGDKVAQPGSFAQTMAKVNKLKHNTNKLTAIQQFVRYGKQKIVCSPKHNTQRTINITSVDFPLFKNRFYDSQQVALSSSYASFLNY